MSDGSKEAKANAKKRPKARSHARFAAVQALYQMDVAQTDLNDVISEFANYRLAASSHSEAEPDPEPKTIDASFFEHILTGIVEKQRQLDPRVNEKLADGWTLTRIDSILRAILRAGAFEILFCKDIPAKVVINEYVNIAHDFFEGQEAKVVNGVLDSLAKQVRSDEMLAKPLS